MIEGDEWIVQLRAFFPKERGTHVILIGVGNPIKSDDSLGLYIISKLRKKYGTNPSSFVKMLPASFAPERILSKIVAKSRDSDRTLFVIFDAIESNCPPGSIIFANIRDTKYGYFVTHNIPLRIIPSVASGTASIFVLGVQPENTEIGESLSATVLASSDRIVDIVGELIAVAH